MGAFLLWTETGAATSSILSFDIVETENPQFPTTITEHVVEEGADVSDNVRVGLRQITLEVFVSNEPIFQGNQFGTGQLSSMPLVTPDADGQPIPPPGGTALTYQQWFQFPIGLPVVGALLSGIVNAGNGITQVEVANIGLDPTLGKDVSAKVIQFPTAFDAVQKTHDQLLKLRDNKQVLSVYGTKATYDSMVIEHFDMSRTSDEGTGAKFTIALKEIRFVSTSIVAAPKPTAVRGNTTKSKGSQSTTPAGQGPVQSALYKAMQLAFPGTTVPPEVQPSATTP